MAYYSETSPTTRAIGFGVVVALHVAIVWALVTGLATTMIEVIKGPIQVETLTEKKEDQAPPPPPPQTLKPPPVYVPPVEVNIAQTTTTSNAIQAVSSTHTNPKIAIPQPEYPEVGRHLKAEGKVVLSADVDERGRVSNVQFVRYEDMTVNDPAVMDAFKKTAIDAVTGVRVKPATNGGQPVAQPGYVFKVTFRCKVGGENFCN